ncbi:MAG TPA: tetratricopeptide repeat protein, partial [Gemmatimonadaceae bacterium]|nr:tetratricopeptide repeat protein [Gemmatimonadaceae bacterium]
ESAASRRSRAVEGLPLLDVGTSTPTGPLDLEFEIPHTPPRPSTLVAAHSVEILRANVEGEPENWSLRRELGEAMLEAGDRAGGIAELQAAMSGAERTSDLALAASLADELARLEPDAVPHHQKRVEYAIRRNDRGRLIEAYRSLADALMQSDQTEKARIVYLRVLDLAPDDAHARAAVESMTPPEPVAPPERSRASATANRRVSQTPVSRGPKPLTPVSSDFVNLGDWLRDEEGPRDTRMVVAEDAPTGNEDADFADMLQKFKRGVSENVEAEDYQAHYDLAIAYKEMGLVDEAIHEFQKALASPANRLATFEALGQCFLDKGQPKMAASILQRATAEPGTSTEKLIGVFYLLGRAAEAQGRMEDAVEFYQRVLVIDIQFRDVADRISEVERMAR